MTEPLSKIVYSPKSFSCLVPFHEPTGVSAFYTSLNMYFKWMLIYKNNTEGSDLATVAKMAIWEIMGLL